MKPQLSRRHWSGWPPLLPIMLWVGVFTSPPLAALDTGDETVSPFIRTMSDKYGFDPDYLRGLLGEAEIKQTILDAISRPAEKTKPWHEYREHFVTPKRIQAGVEFWATHRELLETVSGQTGVAPETLVAILGVETYYGRITGNYRVLDALSTLAFAFPPRSKFFSSELEQFLLLTRESGVDPVGATGSYAGAMGAPQFMPSSFRAYAVDFDEDGVIDLWDNWADVVGSVANYFVAHGWQTGQPVVTRAEYDGSPDALLGPLKLADTVDSLKEKGVVFETDLPADTRTMAVVLDGDEGKQFWVGFKNFYVITRYNRSAMYAMAVHQLGEKIAARMQPYVARNP